MKSHESDVHIWCEGETENSLPLYTLSVGHVCLCRAVPYYQALQYLSDYLEEIAETAVLNFQKSEVVVL